MFTRLAALGALLLACAAAAPAARARNGRNGAVRPRLAVLISIDQFRADYITRFEDLYLPARSDRRVGGFRYLQTAGAWYPDCQYDHHRTVTAAGHAILGTGAQPSVMGIVGNDWWDRYTGKAVYNVDDPEVRVVGATPGSKETPMSPANLLATTVGDELETATGGRARTVSLALKDRATILLGGHQTDTAIWFDEETGGWVSSTFYCKDGRLPEWVSRFNELRLAARLRERPWQPSVDSAAFERIPGDRRSFSHALTGEDYIPFATSPAGNQFVFEAARQAVLEEQLGQDEIPDLLTFNLSSNDYVGHRFGPDSPEVLDISVQTDRQLSEFLNFLARQVPGGLSRVTVALSADHGVAPVPEEHAARGVPASRAVSTAIRAAAEKALDERVGAADWISSFANGELYFSESAVARFPDEPRARLESRVVDAIAGIRGVYFSIGRSAVLAGHVPKTALGRRISNGVHPTRSGDVIVILQPHWLGGAAPVGTGTSHGAPFTYDTHVPLLLAGTGVRVGTYGARVSPAHVAPALSHILGVGRPSAADEPLLPGLAGIEPER